MFEAIIFVCVSSLYVGADKPQCTQFFDTFGPFKTEQNCKIRADQIEEYLRGPDGMLFLIYRLGPAPQFLFKQVCNNFEKELA